MRTPSSTVIATLALTLAGCSSGTTVVRRSPSVPRPVPVVVEPLEVDIARPYNGKVYVQTNRPAYVAIFDIMPERGVALVYPVSARQRRFVVSGMREVPTWWESSRVTYRTAGIGARRAEPERYIYVLASDRPLQLPDEAFGNDYLHATLGGRVYRATNPYATMRALARQFLPPVAEEAWAEDAYGVSRSYATERYRVVRVYCRDGSMYEVPAEFADRVWCGARSRGVSNGPGRVNEVDLTGSERPLRPDSIVGDNGRHLAVRTRGANGRGAIKRVQEPPGWENRANGQDEKVKDEKVKDEKVKDEKVKDEKVKDEKVKDEKVKDEKVKDEKVKDDPPGHGHGNKLERVPNSNPERSDDRPQDASPAGDAAVRNREPAPRRPRPMPERAQMPQSAENAEKENQAEKQTKAEKSNEPETQGRSEKPDKAEKPEKAESPERGDKPDKPEKQLRPEHNAEPKSEPKPKSDFKADEPSEPKPAAEPQPKAESKDEAKAQEKPQSPSDKRGEPEKGRGRPNASDDKSGEKKSKQAPDSKPLN